MQRRKMPIFVARCVELQRRRVEDDSDMELEDLWTHNTSFWNMCEVSHVTPTIIILY
jgi:hypothetical protein